MTQQFPNIAKRIKANNRKQTNKTVTDIKVLKTFEELNANWYLKNIGTDSKKAKFAKDFKGYKMYLIDRVKTRADKKLQKELNRLNVIGNSPDFQSASVSVEWKRSQTWGHNPRAVAEVYSKPHGYKSIDSGSVSGCGYCKLSTAVAAALNASDSFLKLLYKEFNRPKNNGKTPHDVFGYGSGYSLPQLSGGVGVSCYPDVLKTVGYEFKTVASGKSFDAYTIEPIKSTH